jgi:release factor H-coupled RctB family protein
MKHDASAGASLRLFASADAWIDGTAESQLKFASTLAGVTAAAGMPDLHPGPHGPVGCAIVSKGVVHPDLVGSDIGCGMTMFVTDLPARKFRAERALDRLAKLDAPWDGDAEEFAAAGGLPATGYASALGTIGGGNHFCEVQLVHEIADEAEAAAAGVRCGDLTVLVHSGSRGLGAAVLGRHRRDGAQALPLDGTGDAYLEEHDRAVRFASLNRSLIGERALAAIRADGARVLDVPHNLAERDGEHVLHRKGAAPADRGLVPIPGSRGDVTILVRPLAGAPEALRSIAHGAGRKHERAWMHGRTRKSAADLARLTRNPFGGHVICADRALLVEEAPDAYKDVRKVVGDLELFGLARTVAILRPVVTFKTATGPLQRRGRA